MNPLPHTARRRLWWTIVLLSSVTSSSLATGTGLHAALADPPGIDPPGTAFFLSRRQAVLDSLPPGSLAVLFSAPVRNRQPDVDFPYRQSSDFLYLTGMEEPASVLLLAPSGFDFDGQRIRELLLVPPADPQHEVWEGRRLGPGGAESKLGIQKATPHTRFEEALSAALSATQGTVFTLPAPRAIDPASILGHQIDALLRQTAAPEAQPRSVDQESLRLRLTRLRAVKTEQEISVLRRAIGITEEALAEAMRSIEPGQFEYEAQAVIEYVFRRLGAQSPGFASIVGSGENSVILHYTDNRKRMEAGELVVMDVGAEVHGYTADVTRTVPVSGRFTADQRALYEVVLRAQQAAIDACRPGAPFSAPHRAASRELAGGLAELGLIDGPGDVRGLSRFFLHGTSHYLGLDVHDVGAYGRLEPGNVITVEPGLYVRPAPDVDPRWWNIGIRIEDDVLISAEGPVLLSGNVPSDPDDIEALMALEGIGNAAVGTR